MPYRGLRVSPRADGAEAAAPSPLKVEGRSVFNWGWNVAGRLPTCDRFLLRVRCESRRPHPLCLCLAGKLTASGLGPVQTHPVNPLTRVGARLEGRGQSSGEHGEDPVDFSVRVLAFSRKAREPAAGAHASSLLATTLGGPWEGRG